MSCRQHLLLLLKKKEWKISFRSFCLCFEQNSISFQAHFVVVDSRSYANIDCCAVCFSRLYGWIVAMGHPHVHDFRIYEGLFDRCISIYISRHVTGSLRCNRKSAPKISRYFKSDFLPTFFLFRSSAVFYLLNFNFWRLQLHCLIRIFASQNGYWATLGPYSIFIVWKKDEKLWQIRYYAELLPWAFDNIS